MKPERDKKHQPEPTARPSVVLMTAACCAAMATCALSGCKPTDFFTEVVITPDAQTVDYDNPDKPIVNSSTADTESDDFSSLSFSDDSQQTDNQENLIVYASKDANTEEGATVHSVFSNHPDLIGIESSDPVTLQYDSKTESENKVEVDTDKIRKDSKSSKGDDSSKTKTGSKGASGSNSGTSKGESGKSGSGKNNKGKAKTNDKGYDGNDITYDPSGALEDPQTADHVGAIGQAAVMVQALAGKGALAAMDEYTYYGKNSSTGKDDAVLASSFKDVFADELADGFEKGALQWKKDGTSSSCVKDIDKLISQVGKKGVIIFAGHYGDQTEFFSSKQLAKLKNAGIQLVPVDLSSVDGILDSATCVSKVLKNSTEVQYSVKDMASKYKKAVKNILKTSSSSHTKGKGYAAATSTSEKIYSYSDASSTRYLGVYAVFATDFEDGVKYKNSSYSIGTEDGLLFSHISYTASPLSLYAQAAGVVDRAAMTSMVTKSGETDTDLQIVWQFKDARFNRADFGSASNSGPFACLSPYRAKNSKSSSESILLWAHNSNDNLSSGLGSSAMPYLVVSATQSKTAKQVKSAVVKSMGSKDSTYYDYKYEDSGPFSGYCAEKQTVDGREAMLAGFVGYQQDYKGNYFIDGGVSRSDSVLENPTGLLGSWTQGNVESVLETLWIAKVYSAAPANSTYTPINSTDGWSIDIGDDTASTLKDAVKDFYKTFYRYDLDAQGSVSYKDIVTDLGQAGDD